MDRTSFYSYQYNSDTLWRTNIATGEDFCCESPAFNFKSYSWLSQLPGGLLLITGGCDGSTAVSDVRRIDALRDFAVVDESPMLSARYAHCVADMACLRGQRTSCSDEVRVGDWEGHRKPLDEHLYVIGGYDGSNILADCERYVYADKRWEALPPLPKACREGSVVVLEESLFVLWGYHGGFLDFIQNLSLERLTWKIIWMKVPQADRNIPCFQHDSQGYFVLNKSLYSIKPLQALKAFPDDIKSNYGPCYYHTGTLFCSFSYGPAKRWEIGSLTRS